MESNEDFRKLIGKKLRTLRREAGLSQRDLARKLNLSHQQIQKYERGNNALPLRRIKPFAFALGVAPANLMFPEVGGTDIDSSADLTLEQAELLRLYNELPDLESRRKLLELLRSLGKFAKYRI